jgi:hypothetical protein
MTTHSRTIRNVMRTLVAGLLATCVSAVWPLSAQAGKGGGGGGGGHQDMSFTKGTDKGSPNIAKQNGSAVGTKSGSAHTNLKYHFKNTSVQSHTFNGGGATPLDTKKGKGAGNNSGVKTRIEGEPTRPGSEQWIQ